MSRPSVLIWDLGRVFVGFVDIYNSEAFLRKCSVAREDVRRFFTTEGPFWEAERRNEADKELFLAVKNELGYNRDFAEFERDFSDDMELNLTRDVFNFFLDFKGLNLNRAEHWMLTNLNNIHRKNIYKRWPELFVNFSEVFASCNMGTRKPEEEIYVRALERGGRKAEDCLFIDDKQENVEAARGLGINSLQFTGLPELGTWLRGFGFVTAPISLPQR